MVTQKKFNLDRILNNKETPKLRLFSNGEWVESQGAYEQIPFVQDKRISIAEVPALDLGTERLRIKESMQKVLI
jgi:hypothetical protein